jgi:hypothetical protein
LIGFFIRRQKPDHCESDTSSNQQHQPPHDQAQNQRQATGFLFLQLPALSRQASVFDFIIWILFFLGPHRPAALPDYPALLLFFFRLLVALFVLFRWRRLSRSTCCRLRRVSLTVAFRHGETLTAFRAGNLSACRKVVRNLETHATRWARQFSSQHSRSSSNF